MLRFISEIVWSFVIFMAAGDMGLTHVSNHLWCSRGLAVTKYSRKIGLAGFLLARPDLSFDRRSDGPRTIMRRYLDAHFGLSFFVGHPLIYQGISKLIFVLFKGVAAPLIRASDSSWLETAHIWYMWS